MQPAPPVADEAGRIWFLRGSLRMPNSDAYVIRQYRPGQALDGALDKVALAEDRPDVPLAFRTGHYALQQGCRVKPDHLVRTYQWPSSKPLDLIQNLVTVVSGPMRAAIEQLEPGVHQFEPLALVNAKRELFDERHVLIVGCRLDCVNEAATIGFRKPEGPHSWSGRQWAYDETTRDARLIYSRAKAAGRHLWIAGDVAMNGTALVSDALKQELERRGLTGLELIEAPSA